MCVSPAVMINKHWNQKHTNKKTSCREKKQGKSCINIPFQKISKVNCEKAFDRIKLLYVYKILIAIVSKLT